VLIDGRFTDPIRTSESVDAYLIPRHSGTGEGEIDRIEQPFGLQSTAGSAAVEAQALAPVHDSLMSIGGEIIPNILGAVCFGPGGKHRQLLGEPGTMR
jgi:hypothetical protein